MLLTDQARSVVEGGSAIRKMFELGAEFRRADKNPIELTLGNPDIGPPEEYYKALMADNELARLSEGNMHGYMPNAGYPGTRKRVAADLESQLGISFTDSDIIMTAGAANALDVILMTLIDPEDVHTRNEVIAIAPYFVEYGNYVRNNQGELVVAHTDRKFDLDIGAIERAITPRTKALILNSPNNPTGVVYKAEKLKELAALLYRKNQEFGTTIACLEDAPYNLLVFEGEEFASILPHYGHSFHVTSLSKSLGIPGERIGYLAAHPELEDGGKDRDTILTAMATNLRTRLVNAPAQQQRVLERVGCFLTGAIEQYEQRVRKLEKTLHQEGFSFQRPGGAFYLFAEIPPQFENLEDFETFAHQGDEPLLYVPGPGFGGKRYDRHVRLSACVSDDTIKRACARIPEICAMGKRR